MLSSGSRKASAVGDVVNLVSVDVQRLTDSVLYLNRLWLPLIWIVICFVYLWQVRVVLPGQELSSPLLPTCTAGTSQGKSWARIPFW